MCGDGDEKDLRESRREIWANSLSVAEAAPVAEAVKLGAYVTVEEFSFCRNMARLYGCYPLETDEDNFYRFLAAIYHYGCISGMRTERVRRKGGDVHGRTFNGSLF